MIAQALQAAAGKIDWFVDSVSGNDGNTGRSAAQAFETLATLSLNAGDKIALARGSYWYEDLPIAINFVAVSTYGSGDRPILDARYKIPASDWSVHGAGTATYKATITFDTGGWMSAWENGTRMTLGSADDSLTSGQYFVDSHTNGNTTLYVRLSDDSDPGGHADGYVQHAKLNGGIQALNKRGLNINGINTIANISNNGSIVVGRNTVLTDCLIEEGTKHNLLFTDGSRLVDVEAKNIYYANQSATMYVYNEDTPAGLGINFTRCIARQESSYPGGPYVGFYGHNNISGDYGDIVYDDCECYGLVSGGITGGECQSLTVNNLYVENCILAIRFPVDTTINGITLVRDDGGNTSLCTFALANLTVIINDARICLSGSSATPTALIYIDKTGLDFTVDGTVFDGSGGGNGTFLFMANGQSDNCTVTLTNNTYRINAGRYYSIAGGGTLPANLDFSSDYNCFFSDDPNIYWAATDYATVGAWQAGTGQDSNSIIGGCDVSAAPC